MDNSLKALTEMTFKRSENVNISDLSLDYKLMNIYWAMDGSRNFKAVAREDGYDLEELAEGVQNLMKIGALESTQAIEGNVAKETIDMLTKHLSQAIGPMADILVEDTIADLGHSLSSFPKHKLGQLVNQLALEIGDEDKSQSFRTSMAHLIN
jgi:hypothetical protein